MRPGNLTYCTRLAKAIKGAVILGIGVAALSCDGSSGPTTIDPPDPAPPGVSSVSPSDGATSVAVNAPVSVTFNRPMNASTINSSTIMLAPSGGSSVPATVTFNADSKIATLIPASALNTSTTYRLTITTGVQGSNNFALPAQFNTTFTTVAAGSSDLSPIVLDFCSSVPIFFAYKNTGDAWTRVLPDNRGSFSFMATPKVAITFVRGIETDTYYTTSEELKTVSRLACNTSGTKTLNGSFANLGPLAPSNDPSYGIITAGKQKQQGPGAFTLRSVPDGSVDLVAVDYPYADGSWSPAKAIIRRNLLYPSGSTVPVFDFASIEAVQLATNQLAVTGGLSSDFNYVFVDFNTANGTNQNWNDGQAYRGATRTFHSFPASILVEGDLHKLTFHGDASDFLSARSAILYFRQASDRNIVLGSKLNQPTFTRAATSPYLRIRGTMPSQADYGSAVQFIYTQGTTSEVEGERDWAVTGTVGYFGGTTPSTWDLEMPDLSAVPGFPVAAAFNPTYRTTPTAQAWSDLVSLFVGRAPRDGDVVKFASWRLPDIPGTP